MSNKRKRYAPAFKAKVALAALGLIDLAPKKWTRSNRQI